MRNPRRAACGSWHSPISAQAASGSGLRLMQPRAQGDWIYWVESRPAEQGRCVLMRGKPGQEPQALLPAPYSARSRVHEYGGGAYAVHGDALAFVNDADQQIYLLTDGIPRRLTDAPGSRFGDLGFDPEHARLICVRERHTGAGIEPENSLAAVSLHDGAIHSLAQGHDFYSSPALDRGAQRLAWLQWDHPRMPWDGCALCCAELDAEGAIKTTQLLAGGESESLFQPQFAPDGSLHFLSDRNGWWNIYRVTPSGNVAVTTDAADYGLAQWNLGMSRYGFRDDGALLAVRNVQGRAQLIEIQAGVQRLLPLPLTQIEHLHVHGNVVAMLGSSPQTVNTVYAGTDARHGLRRSTQLELAAACISVAQPIRFQAADSETVHAWYYPPCNPGYRAPETECPPLIVKCHGGPTAMNGDGLDPRIQFWTSRGFAVVDVNYRGSSGFGRAYRCSLHGAWGIKDVEDCIGAARWLAERGLADAERTAISGSSAGGFTVLSALAFHDYFRAGAVYYGISELASAMTDTHKFEARYGDSLLGRWPEAAAVYRARSPLYAAENIRCPVIFFQGLRDRVVPPDQTERMVTALQAGGQTVSYITFPEEGHGFRRADSLCRALEEELAFYARVFGFVAHDADTPQQP
ncbi:MAG TPA: S9 family peptidase [Gammaproteobacteria bacterium]|nr:S9 family peptidase [Gammaproteobacteria bacterium]